MDHILVFQDCTQKIHVNFPPISLTKANHKVKTDGKEMEKSHHLLEKGNEYL